MPPALNRAVEWIRRRAENLVAALLAMMFLAFIVQIVFRYVFNFPVGWTTELSVIAWLYMVLLGSAFWLKEDEEIRFDLLTHAVGPRAKSLIALAVSIAAVVLFGMALPATVKYIAFMKVESTSYLKIRLDILYSVYAVFAVAVVLRYAWAAWRALQGEAPEEVDIAHKGHGL
jgi:C4-dicarboxylate transporter DctQ subunit